MTTSGPMNVVRVVASALMSRRTSIRVDRRDRDDVLVDMAFVGVMKMPVMEVVDMPIMLDSLVAATWAVDMVV